MTYILNAYTMLLMASYCELYHVRIDLAESRGAKDVLQKLLLGVDPHPKEKVQASLQQVNAPLRQPLFRVPDCHRQNITLHI